MRVLREARPSARKARSQALNQMRSLVSTGPEEVRDPFRSLTGRQLVTRAAALRPRPGWDATTVTKLASRSLARRIENLDEETAALTAQLEPLVTAVAPALLALPGVCVDCASALLVAAGDNPDRLRSERTFCAPVRCRSLDASSGMQERHRLNRGGDRQANSALWRIVITRIVYDPRTRIYIDRRTKEGLTKKEVIRCLKR